MQEFAFDVLEPYLLFLLSHLVSAMSFSVMKIMLILMIPNFEVKHQMAKWTVSLVIILGFCV